MFSSQFKNYLTCSFLVFLGKQQNRGLRQNYNMTASFSFTYVISLETSILEVQVKKMLKNDEFHRAFFINTPDVVNDDAFGNSFENKRMCACNLYHDSPCQQILINYAAIEDNRSFQDQRH